MKIYSWNVNGVRAVYKKGDFTKFVETHQPDILCLQETKAEQGESPVDLPEYKEYWNSSQGKKGYSGTAIFTRTKPLNVINDIPEDISKKFELEDGYGNPNKEGRVIVAEFREFFVVSVYTPNSKGDLSRLELRHKAWDKAFLAYMDHLQKSKPVIYCGDFNVAHTEIDLARPDSNRGKHGFTDEEREGFEKMLKKGFLDTYRLFNKDGGKYTWWTHWANARARNIGWRIDYIMVSNNLKNNVKSAEIYDEILGSDHCPISIELAI